MHHRDPDEMVFIADVAGADKATTKTDNSKEASTAPVKTDGAKTDTTKTN
jgi:hypothetical protein